MNSANSPLVGRAGFEPATNGLKARYAFSARPAFPLSMGRMAGIAEHVSPLFCQILPTCEPLPGDGDTHPKAIKNKHLRSFFLERVFYLAQ